MTTRTAKVVLDLLVDKYISNAKRASQAIKEVGDEAEKAGKKTDQSTGEQAKAAEKAAAASRKQAEAAQTAGVALTAFGTASVAALGAATKAAMDWESAWAGVTKTVDGTPEQMAQLETGLRGLAKTLPITHQELAGVAEAAGQLGVKREDILKFTKTMVDLGQTTNLTAEEAATDIAQIANVMGTTGDEIDNFGATLVALGNDGASTEKDILSMAQRIAGAGKLVGATEGEVLALSNTLASMGIRAELGGGVATRVLLGMYKAVQDGGPKLDAFAKAAGTTAEEFGKKFAGSPVEALNMVTKGMERTKAEGGNVVQVLKDMGFKGTEEMQVMLALAGAGDLLSESLALQAVAWEENTALIDEATKRYETTESKVKVAWNGIKDAAIDAGAVMLPVVQGIAENVTNLASGFGDLPAPLQGAVAGLTGVAGAAGLVAGGALLIIPKIKETAEAFATLNTRTDGSSRGLDKWGKAAGIAAGAFVGFEIIKSVHNSMQEGGKSTEEMTQALIGLKKGGDGLNKVFKDIGAKEFEGELGNAGQALNKLINQDFNSAIESFGATALGVDNGMAKISDAFKKTDLAVAGAVSSGNLDLAAQGFKSVADSAAEQGIKVEDVAKRFPNYLNALREVANQSKVDVSETDLLNWALGKVPPAMEAAAAGGDKAAQAFIDQGAAAAGAAPLTEEVAEALADVGLNADGTVAAVDRFMDVLLNAGLITLSARDASRQWSQSLLDMGLQADGTGGAIGSLGTAFDNTTAQGIKNQAMFDGVAQAGIRNVQALAKNKASNEEVQGALRGTYDGLIAAAGQFGITGEQADTLTRKVLGVPDGVSIDSWMSSEAKRIADETTGAVNRIPSRKDVLISIREETHRIAYEQRVVQSGGAEPDGGGLYGSDSGRREGGAIQKLAGGGRVRGRGSSTSDDVPIWASDGEHMLDKGDVNKLGGQAGVYKFRRNLQAGMFDHLAEGGGVGQSIASKSVAARSLAPALSLEGLVVNVQNPWTGAEVQGVVKSVAQQVAGAAVEAAGRDIDRGRSV